MGIETTQDNPDYMVVERGAKTNPWSRLNYWWHVNELRELKDNTTGFALTNSHKEQQIHLEFDRDIELFNWGIRLIQKIDIVADKKKEDIEGLALGFVNKKKATATRYNFPQDETAIIQKVYRVVDNSGVIASQKNIFD